MIAAILREMRDELGGYKRLAHRVGLSPKRVKDLTEVPGEGAKVRDFTAQRIVSEYHTMRPYPLKPWQRVFRDELVEAKAEPGSMKLLVKIQQIKGAVSDSYPSCTLGKFGNNYLMYLACFSHAFHHSNSPNFGTESEWRAYSKAAEEELSAGLLIIRQLLKDPPPDANQEQLECLEEIFFSNLMITVFFRSQHKHARSMDDVLKYLREQDAVGKLRKFLKSNPYLWQAAYNGLEFSSRLHADDATMFWFYYRLCENDPGFTDFDYSPGEVASINAEDGMAYFRSRYAIRHVTYDCNKHEDDGDQHEE